MNQSPFTPGATDSITISGSSQSKALPTGGANGLPQVMLTNGPAGTPAICYIKFGNSAVTAAATDMPILPNTQICLTPPTGTTHIAVIGTVSGVLYFTVGHGVLG